MTPKTDRPSVEQQLSDYQVPEPVCATVRALLTKVEELQEQAPWRVLPSVPQSGNFIEPFAGEYPPKEQP